MSKANPYISSWSLFGESSELPDVLHCETIAARSVQYDWELAPHRHARLHQVLLLQRGRGEVQLEDRLLPLPPMSLVNIPVGVVHAFRFERGTGGWVTTFADVMLQALAMGSGGDVRQALGQCAVVPAPAPLFGLVAQLMDEFEARAPARALVLRGLGASLVGYTARLLAEHADAAVDTASPLLLQRFQALLDAQVAARWTVADYAKALAVTPGHLSRVTRDATGQPASKLIDEQVVREARRQLAYTRAPVGVVAESLGFADVAHFSRLFTRATGLSPRAFRKGLGLAG